MNKVSAALITLFCLCITRVSLWSQEFPESLQSLAPLPVWVDSSVIDLEQAGPLEEVSGGAHYHNIEFQWHVPSQTRYYRSVVSVVNEAGLENNGE